MLETSLFSPAKPRCAGTRLFPCGVLALLTVVLLAERRVLARRGWAGENRGLFEHPASVLIFHLAMKAMPEWFLASGNSREII